MNDEREALTRLGIGTTWVTGFHDDSGIAGAVSQTINRLAPRPACPSSSYNLHPLAPPHALTPKCTSLKRSMNDKTKEKEHRGHLLLLAYNNWSAYQFRIWRQHYKSTLVSEKIVKTFDSLYWIFQSGPKRFTLLIPSQSYSNCNIFTMDEVTKQAII